jgi:hypothetical protein
MLLLLFRLLTISFAFHFYKNRYPKEYEAYSNQLFEKLQNSEMLKPLLPYIIKFGYVMIYIYSFFQILLNKVISKCLPYVKLARDKTSDYLVKHNIMSEKVFTNASNKTTPTELSYELSNIRFIALYLKYDDKTYSIDLHNNNNNNNNNNYIIGNVLNSAFYKDYLTNVLNIIIDNNKPFLYELELMDHNVSMVFLNEKQNIIIEKDDYKIVDNIATETEETLVVLETIIAQEEPTITEEEPNVLEPTITQEITIELTDIVEAVVNNTINDESILSEDIKAKIQ